VTGYSTRTSPRSGRGNCRRSNTRRAHSRTAGSGYSASVDASRTVPCGVIVNETSGEPREVRARREDRPHPDRPEGLSEPRMTPHREAREVHDHVLLAGDLDPAREVLCGEPRADRRHRAAGRRDHHVHHQLLSLVLELDQPHVGVLRVADLHGPAHHRYGLGEPVADEERLVARRARVEGGPGVIAVRAERGAHPSLQLRPKKRDRNTMDLPGRPRGPASVRSGQACAAGGREPRGPATARLRRVAQRARARSYSMHRYSRHEARRRSSNETRVSTLSSRRATRSDSDTPRRPSDGRRRFRAPRPWVGWISTALIRSGIFDAIAGVV